MFCTPIFNVTTELGQLVHDPWEKHREWKKQSYMNLSVESDLSELQLSEHVGYLNTPTISGYFCQCEVGIKYSTSRY